MLKKYVAMSLILVLLLAVMSCQRLPARPSGTDLVDLKTIPASYGNLVSVTSIPAYPEWVQLWFQDATGTIRIIRVDFGEYQMASDIRTVTRD